MSPARPLRQRVIAAFAAASFTAAVPVLHAAEPVPTRKPASAEAGTGGPASAPEVRAQFSWASGACTDGERWRYGATIYSEGRDEMGRLLAKQASPVWGFVQALGLRRQAPNVEARYFAEYFISRSLLDASLTHIAWNGFASIAARPVSEETLGVQLAALACLTELHRRFPTLPLPERVTERMPEYLAAANAPREKNATWEYAAQHLRVLLSDGKATGSIDQAFGWLKGSGMLETFYRGVEAARTQRHKQTVQHLERFTAVPQHAGHVERLRDQAHLLLARAYYSQQQFERAAEQFKLIRKSSNELARGLNDLAWAFLMDERYAEAIGTAINLQQGSLRHTFTPEAPMVMAMALNELCQYPESLRAVNTFRRYYEKPYKWLGAQLYGKDPNRPDLYSQAVQFLKKDPAIPAKVGSEWVRSPLFIAHQDEINLLFTEKENTARLSRAGSTGQRQLAAEIAALSAELKTRIRATRATMKPGQDLPRSLQSELGKLRVRLNHYQRFRQGAPVWRVILARFEKTVNPRRATLVRAINADLRERAEDMFTRIEEVAENNQLIEVEIYNGASQDIIWQNAHPDYKELAQKMREDHESRAAAKSWDWGRKLASEADGDEIWEDELGSFKADLFNNCSSKDKFLALKRRR
jgi:hypothetical protein